MKTMNKKITEQEQEQYEAAFNAMYSSCLNSLGVYEALEMVGQEKTLPGLSICKKHLHKAIELAEKTGKCQLGFPTDE